MDDSKLAYTVEEAAKALSISPWLVREEMVQKRIKFVKICRRVVIPRWSLEERLRPTESERDLPVEAK